MNPEELWSTTLNPATKKSSSGSIFKKYKKDQEIIHTLMGNDVSSRKILLFLMQLMFQI